MREKGSRRDMEHRLYLTMTVLVTVILLCSLGFTLAMDIARERKALDRKITDAATYVAELRGVHDMLEAGYPDPGVTEQLEAITEFVSGIDSILIADRNGLRFYQTSRHMAGDMYVDGDETRILTGSAPYITTVQGTDGPLHCAFHAIRNAEGVTEGFVMVSVAVSKITGQSQQIMLVYVAMFLAMLLLSILLTGAFFRFQRTMLLGHEPVELLSLYVKQDEVINSLAEGIVSVGQNGKILFANKPAELLLAGQSGALVGKSLKEVFPDTHFEQILEDGTAVMNQMYVNGDQTLLINEVPVTEHGEQPDGVLLILQDRTEALRLSDELSGARNMMDTLRAFNHEFLNKLHIILGYLQTGEIDKAREFIINSNLVSSQSVRDTANALRVSEVCALVIGKMMHAAESGIRLSLEPGSSLMERDLLMEPGEYVTVIGNLLENAIEELKESGEKNGEIHLGVFAKPGVNVISCEDSGRGIDPAMLDRIFIRGVSTKGKNHGTGLYLVKQVADKYGGEVSVETEPGEGSCFTITLTALQSAERRKGVE
ncbi:sensor histidine kinase [Stomatobaculum longum]|uniref:sensor histidine kinase n=1 Tax=Stomatobaculum longum TaxID=796942 RepID=UPI0028F116A1|nr:ATP-binding protein [Stomatobaculum longum]